MIMSKPVVVDNFLNQSYFDYLSAFINSTTCKWEFQSQVTSGAYRASTLKDGEDNDPWKIGCTRGIYDKNQGIGFDDTDSEIFIPMCLSVADHFGLDSKGCIRCRLDMTFMSQGVQHNPHIDVPNPHWTGILYFSDTDGDTVIYNERWSLHGGRRSLLLNDDGLTVLERITPKKNRLVFFNGLHFHTGHSPTTTTNRILCNMNFSKR